MNNASGHTLLKLSYFIMVDNKMLVVKRHKFCTPFCSHATGYLNVTKVNRRSLSG